MGFASIWLFVVAACPAQELTFREDYADKVVGVKDFGEVFYEQLETGKFSVRFKANLPQALDIASDPLIEAEFGDWSFIGSFSDDPKFKSTATKANIPLAGGKLSLAVAKGVLTGSIAAKTGFNVRYDFYEASPAAARFVGENRPISASGQEPLLFTLTIGESTWQFAASVPVQGKAVSKTVKKGPKDFAEEYLLTKTKLSSVGTLGVRDVPVEPDTPDQD